MKITRVDKIWDDKDHVTRQQITCEDGSVWIRYQEKTGTDKEFKPFLPSKEELEASLTEFLAKNG